VLFCFNSKFTNKINKITKIFVFLSDLNVILLIFFVNSLLKQQNTQLPAIKAVISHEILLLCRSMGWIKQQLKNSSSIIYQGRTGHSSNATLVAGAFTISHTKCQNNGLLEEFFNDYI
jgi:hypothetical protein